MTRDEILNMPAGREMDKLVAEKVMGWHVIEMAGVMGHRLAYVTRDRSEGRSAHDWKPSENIAAAWQVVEKFRQMDSHWCPMVQWDDHDGDDGGAWSCAFVYFGEEARDFRSADADAPTPELAICRAALISVMEGEK